MGGNTKAPSQAAAPDGLGPSTNGLARAQVSEIQRARILAAMVEVVAERGVANVTVAHVVARSSVSRRTFYELFGDREDCFLAAFDDAISRAKRHMLDEYDPKAKWVERVRTALTALLRFLDVERGAGQLLIVGSLGAGHRALERRRRGIVQIVALVDEGRNETKAGSDLPALTAEGIVGGVLSVLHSRLLDFSPPPTAGPLGLGAVASPGGDSLLGLTGPLMGMIVLPYLGPVAARREVRLPPPTPARTREPTLADPLRDVPMRLTYRTVRVLTAIAELGERGTYPSNREIGVAAGMRDQGQISKLLTRLCKLGLIENSSPGLARGAPNAWVLTDRGAQIEQVLGEPARS
jgi:AcrR family transcriptional regulator